MEDTFKMYDAVKETEVQKNDDSETMNHFASLVQEYLTLQDRPIEHPPEAGIEYVYDIFYKEDDSNPPTANNRWQNVASAIWADGENEVLPDEDSSGSQYFTEDEDSNAEDHYTHDYPDEDEVYSDQDSDYHEADFYDSHDVIDSDNDYEEEDDAV
ncbi:520_t:CDS:2 [Paraglomus brasilianum]|uniref:520_t:CDS:1 n=1 Tax=Paraglomus brasilianum TaxID=144538 RepID=A0A9N9FHN2_9GLOM|nr:520_t:CDS:2 [Paraglomus brasilianum]